MLTTFIQAARLIVYLERLWAAFIVPFIVLAALLATAALGLWAPLPFILHAGLLGAIGLGFTAAVVLAFLKRPPYPTVAEGRAIVERRHHLEHRPVTLSADSLSQNTTDPEVAALWAKAQQQASKQAAKAGAVRAHTHTIKADKWALRYPLAILLVFALWLDWGTGFYDLRQTFNPVEKQYALQVIQGIDVWVTPPEYTQQPAFLYKAKGATAEAKSQLTKIPRDSTLKVLVHVSEPLRQEPEATYGEAVTMPLKGNTYSASLKATESDTLWVTYRGRTLFEGQFSVAEDLPPKVTLSDKFTRTPEGMLDIPFMATDDYGIAKITAIAQHGDYTAEKELVLPRVGATEIDDSSYADFTAEPIAGLVVDFTLKAEDQAGQTASSMSLKVQLPERPFNHPVAKKLVQLRKTLFQYPDQRENITKTLRQIMDAPKEFDDNKRAYLSMTFAYRTLADNAMADATERTMGLLWDAALQIEKGPLGLQLERMLNAQRNLQKALSEGADSETIDHLFRELAQAMNDLMRSAQFGNMDMESLTGTPTLQNRDLAELMQKINDLLKAGAYDEAREALKQLEKMMAHVQFGDNPAMEEFQKAMQGLQSIMKQQEALIEEAFNNEVAGRMTAEQRLRQQLLGTKLSEQIQALQKLGFDTSKLNEAMMNMNGAFKLSGRPGFESLVYEMQNRALQLMQQGQQGIAQQIRQQMGYGGMAGMRRDPSGKLHPMAGENVEIPDEAPETLSRKIRKELFDRADDIGRGDQEQQYLRRLLDAF